MPNTLDAYVGLLRGETVIGSARARFTDRDDGFFVAPKVRIKVRSGGKYDAVEVLGAGVLRLSLDGMVEDGSVITLLNLSFQVGDDANASRDSATGN